MGGEPQGTYYISFKRRSTDMYCPQRDLMWKLERLSLLFVSCRLLRADVYFVTEEMKFSEMLPAF